MALDQDAKPSIQTMQTGEGTEVMSHRFVGKYVTAVLLGTTAIGFGMGAQAQSTAQTSSAGQQVADADIQQVEQITVTATRRVERLQDVPISIAVFNQQQLSDHNVVSAQDLAAYTPSLSANSNYGNDNTSFAIRGFVQDTGTAPSVGTYFADVVEPRGASNGLPTGSGAGPGDFFDLENVQVLKGPQGTLFGRNTTGGDVLLVPQKPTDQLGGYIEGSYGNYDLQRIQAVLNVPLAENIRFRVGLDHESQDGYLRNTSDIGTSRYDGINYTAVRASLDIDVTSNIENYTIASYTHSDTTGSVQKMIACAPNTSIFTLAQKGPTNADFLINGCSQMTPGAANYQGGGFYDVGANDMYPASVSNTYRAINTTSWQISDNIKVKNIASYSQYNDIFNSPIFGTNFILAAEPANPLGFPFPAFPAYPVGFAESVAVPHGYTANEQTYTDELQFQGQAFGDRLIWQAGGYLESSDPLSNVGSQTPGLIPCQGPGLANLNCQDVGGAELAFGTFPVGVVNYTAGKTAYRDRAGYVQGTYKITDELKFTGGLRYTQDSEFADTKQVSYHFPAFYAGPPSASFCTNPLSNAQCVSDYAQHSHAPTWLLDLDYTPTDNLLFYAKYSRGYRAGTIAPNVSAPFNYVQPEKVDTFEGGVKSSWEGAISGIVDAAGFYNDFSNQQLQVGFDPNPDYQNSGFPAPVSATAAPVNAGKSRIYGAELDATIIPMEGVTLRADYTYLNTEIVKSTLRIGPPGPNDLYEVFGQFIVGGPLELSPTNKATFTASYTLPLDESIGKVTAGATFTHTDRMLTNYGDSALGGAFAGLDYVQATNLLGLNVDWANVGGRPMDLSLFATNVTGEKYYTYIPGLAGEGFETASVGAPAMWGVRLRYTFGD